MVWVFAQFPVFFYASATLVCVIAGISICGIASKTLDSHDHPGIVWDEIAGMMLTMIFIPFSWLNLGLGFLLFRIFDILKPWPIRLVDRKVGGGLGIMLDDILAAVFANILLRIVLHILPQQ
jgi:phosphatidylglycerophosphatase A